MTNSNGKSKTLLQLPDDTQPNVDMHHVLKRTCDLKPTEDHKMEVTCPTRQNCAHGTRTLQYSTEPFAIS